MRPRADEESFQVNGIVVQAIQYLNIVFVKHMFVSEEVLHQNAMLFNRCKFGNFSNAEFNSTASREVMSISFSYSL